MGLTRGDWGCMGPRRLTAATIAATTLAITGCGGSAKPLTHAELVSKANAICETVTTRLAKNSIKSEQDIARVAPELASFEQKALSELSKLVPPADLESDWKQFIAGAEMLAENTSKIGEYAKANNLKAAGTLITSSETTQHQMQAIAKRDGLSKCEQVA
jgi:nucleotidyltransferase/DNA polymerase involved in DNA repair